MCMVCTDAQKTFLLYALHTAILARRARVDRQSFITLPHQSATNAYVGVPPQVSEIGILPQTPPRTLKYPMYYQSDKLIAPMYIFFHARRRPIIVRNIQYLSRSTEIKFHLLALGKAGCYHEPRR